KRDSRSYPQWGLGAELRAGNVSFRKASFQDSNSSSVQCPNDGAAMTIPAKETPSRKRKAWTGDTDGQRVARTFEFIVADAVEKIPRDIPTTRVSGDSHGTPSAQGVLARPSVIFPA